MKYNISCVDRFKIPVNIKAEFKDQRELFNYIEYLERQLFMDIQAKKVEEC